MKSILFPFEEQYHTLQQEISSKKYIKIGTLGPNGTSSEQAVKYLLNLIEPINQECEFSIQLRDDFKYVFDALDNNEIDYALIPTAYERITDYFWHPRFKNILNFIYHTPDYGMISKKGMDYKNVNKLRIASCPAVQGIFNYLIEDLPQNCNVEIVTTRSTTEAVLYVLDNKADAGITNETSYELYKDKGIEFITQKYNAHIVWSLFKNKFVS